MNALVKCRGLGVKVATYGTNAHLPVDVQCHKGFSHVVGFLKCQAGAFDGETVVKVCDDYVCLHVSTFGNVVQNVRNEHIVH